MDTITDLFLFVYVLIGVAAIAFFALFPIKLYWRKQSKKVYALLDHMPDLIWLTNAEGKYLYVNDAFAVRILMCSSNYALGKTIQQIANEQLLVGVHNNFGALFNSTDDTAKTFGSARKFLEIGKINNKFVALETFKIPMYEKNKFIGMLGIASDITNDVTEHALLDSFLESGNMEAFKKLFNDHKFKYITSPAKSCYPEFLRKAALEEIT